MKLKTTARAADRKGESKRLRREGKIPAVLYVKGEKSLPIAVEQGQYEAVLRRIKKGYLPTTRFKLEGEFGVKEVIVKGVDYDPITYQVRHLDFLELEKDKKVRVKVPITFKGEADCVGVKQGGVLRQVIRHLHVECTPEHLPDHYTIDVTNMDLNQSKKLKTIKTSEHVRLLISPEEVAVIVAKR